MLPETVRKSLCISNRDGSKDPDPHKMALFVTIVKGFQPLPLSSNFILDKIGFLEPPLSKEH